MYLCIFKYTTLLHYTNGIRLPSMQGTRVSVTTSLLDYISLFLAQGRCRSQESTRHPQSVVPKGMTEEGKQERKSTQTTSTTPSFQNFGHRQIRQVSERCVKAPSSNICLYLRAMKAILVAHKSSCLLREFHKHTASLEEYYTNSKSLSLKQTQKDTTQIPHHERTPCPAVRIVVD